ncbi:MAG: hypothetical protein ACK5M7_04105 [Draconibacterium sp.]
MPEYSDKTVFLKIILLIVSILVTHYSNGQNKCLVRGSVLDEENIPIPFTTIIANESGTIKPYSASISATNGTFQFHLPPGKDFDIRFTSIGFAAHSYQLNTDTLSTVYIGEIVMKRDTIALQEVEVRPLIQVTDDEIIYNLSADPERDSLNMKQIVDKLPKIRFENGALKTEMGGRIIATRKGKEDALFKGVEMEYLLERIPASGFSQIRIKLDPSEKFEDAEYVVEFTPEKDRQLVGFMVSPKASYSLQDNSLNPGMTLTGSIDKLRFSIYGNTKFNNPPTSYYTRIFEDYSNQTLLEQKQENNEDRVQYVNNLALSYDIAKNQYLGISLAYNTDQQNLLTSENSILSDLTGSNNELFSSSFKTSEESIKDWKGKINYELDFDKKGRNLSLSFLMGGKPQKETITTGSTDENNIDQEKRQQVNTTSLDDQKFQIYYTDVFSQKIQFRSSFAYSQRNNSNSSRAYQKETEIWDESVLDDKRFKNIVKAIDGIVSGSFRSNSGMKLSSSVKLSYTLSDERWVSNGGNMENQYTPEKLLFGTNNEVAYGFKNSKLLNNIKLAMGYHSSDPIIICWILLLCK